MRTRSVALALLVPLALATVAEAGFVVRLLPEEQEGGVPVQPSRVVWSSEPGVRCELQESTDLTQPRSSTTLQAGDPLRIHAKATAAWPYWPSYDWLKDGPLYQYGGRDLVISRVNISHTGNYHVRAKAGGATANSDTATVPVTGGPVPAGDYMVIDLSAGPSASSYPVSYLSAVPPGGWTDEYKTTKMVLRRIPAGTFTMGSPTGELGRDPDETQHEVTLTQDLYVGVFEVTQKQWERVMGTWPSYFSNVSYWDARPVERVSYDMIRGSSAGTGWPANNDVDADSFMGRLRERTGRAFDLPTESQWEYACRAGTTTALNSGKNLTGIAECPNMSEVGRYYYNHPGGYSSSSSVSTDGGTAKVGSYLANAWGLHDMHGNVWEWCLDWGEEDYPGRVTDPRGATTGSYRVFRGGGWYGHAWRCRSAFRSYFRPYNVINVIGFRAAVPPGQ